MPEKTVVQVLSSTRFSEQKLCDGFWLVKHEQAVLYSDGTTGTQYVAEIEERKGKLTCATK